MSSLFLDGCDGGLIYKVSMQEARSGATLPGRQPMIPMIHVNLPFARMLGSYAASLMRNMIE
jgi:hypothetical protein